MQRAILRFPVGTVAQLQYHRWIPGLGDNIAGFQLA